MKGGEFVANSKLHNCNCKENGSRDEARAVPIWMMRKRMSADWGGIWSAAKWKRRVGHQLLQ